jgi:hypothetical protein
MIEIILDMIQLFVLGFISALLLSWFSYGIAYGFKSGLIDAENNNK